MIFCTVGNDRRPFKRFSKVVEVICKYKPKINIIYQYGHSPKANSKIIKNIQFLKSKEFDFYLKNSSHIFCHGGAGTLLDIKHLNKKPLVFVRNKIYGEHIDNHQLEIVNFFYKKKYIFKYENNADLLNYIKLKKPYLSTDDNSNKMNEKFNFKFKNFIEKI